MGSNTIWNLSNILNICSALPGVPDGQGLQFWDYSIGSIAPGKLNQAQIT